MTVFRRTTAIAVIVALGGCASTPRGFAPLLDMPPADASAFEVAFQVCGEQVAAGRRDQFRAGRATSATTGLALGGAAALATAGSAASGAGMLAGAAAGAGLAIGLVVFAPLAIFGASRIQRANKEREIKAAMAACMAEEGYVIEDWRIARDGETGPASPTQAPDRP